MIYLDNSATTQIDDDVVEAMMPWLRDRYGNASSIYQLGREARIAIEDARTEIAGYLNAHPAELIFTSGGTESNNAILKSCLQESGLADHLAYSSVEHHAVIHPAEVLSEIGVKTTTLPVDDMGFVHIDGIAAVNSDRTLVSVMHVNNETGAIQPLSEVRQAAPDALLHSDAVQSFGKISVDVQELGLDLASISAHKIHGPKGVGAMFIRKGLDFKAHQQGGGQERNRRAGTEPVALIVGFQHAARKAVAELEARAAHMGSLTQLLVGGLQREIPDLRLNTDLDRSAPHIVNVSFLDAEHLDGEAILQAMDMRGVAVSNGSACVSGSLQASHVLLAMGRSRAEAKAAVRFSVCNRTTEKDVEDAIAIMSNVIRNMRVATHN